MLINTLFNKVFLLLFNYFATQNQTRWVYSDAFHNLFNSKLFYKDILPLEIKNLRAFGKILLLTNST